MKKKIKRVIFCLLFCILFAGCGKVLRYLLIDDTASYTRVAFHEMYEQDNIDVLFVGSSHCYRTFVPEILDDRLGVNTFNAGTSSQNLDGSYMVIKEAARYNNIRKIYLELYYDVAFTAYKDRIEMSPTYIISDYLRPSFDKARYLLNASSSRYYPNSFILARRNWDKLFDIGYMKELFIKKQTDAYKNYEYDYITREDEWYEGKGYVASKEAILNWNYFSEDGWEIVKFEDISGDWMNALGDIICFCQKNGILLTIISAPMPNFRLAGIGNYDDYVKLVKKAVAGTNIGYYDFNLCREEYFPNTSRLFNDTHHLNEQGAEVFSNLFADFANGKISEEELFYSSYEEKISSLEPTVFGVSYHDVDNGNGETERECKIVSTSNDNLEYKIVLAPDEKNPYVYQEFSKNRFFTIVPEEHGVCTITYHVRGVPDSRKTIDISY